MAYRASVCRILSHARRVQRVPVIRSSAICRLGTNVHTPSGVALRTFASHAVVDLLEREHAEELENPETSSTPPGELGKLLSEIEQDWKLVDDGALTKLHRALSDVKVQLSFHCQDTVENMDYAEDEEEEAAPSIRVTITLTRAGKTLLMTCVTDPHALKLNIQSTAISTEDVSSLQESGGAVLANQYQGPEFLELAQDLQQSFHDYLEEHVGISEDVVAFISMYCDWKEQQEYVKFLEDAKALMG